MIGVLAVDPGQTTGVVFLEWNQDQEQLPTKIISAEPDEQSFAKTIEPILANKHSYDRFYVTCERFIINAQTVRNSQAPYSLEQIGVLKHLCRVNGYDPAEISFQAPVDAKNMFPNPALKKVGVWHVGGGGHALDAARHALLKMTKAGWKPKILLD